MMFSASSAAALLLLPLSATASPLAARAAEPSVTVTIDTEPSAAADESYNWAKGWTADFPIHESCNVTLRAELRAGLKETQKLAAHARDHLLAQGNKSEIVQRYFGNASLSGPIGFYSRVVSANKDGMLFRCDDPDRNCETQEGWAGHWRGENATQETVICDLSFEIRRPLSGVCNLGYTVAESPLNTYWATDLLHRTLHVPLISDEVVEHYAEDYAEVIQLAKDDPSKSVLDSDALQYFAIDAYAYDVAAPGVGCTGEIPEAEEKAEDAEPSASASATEASEPSGTADSDDSCHTHDDGFVHC